MIDPSELLHKIDVHERTAHTAEQVFADDVRRLRNFIDAVAHDRFALEVYIEEGQDPERAADAIEAEGSASANYQNALTTMDEAIHSRIRNLRAHRRAAQIRDSLLTTELTSDEAQLDD